MAFDLWCCIGKGRGRQVIAVARTADVVIMMLDATKGDVQRSGLVCLCVAFYVCCFVCISINRQVFDKARADLSLFH